MIKFLKFMTFQKYYNMISNNKNIHFKYYLGNRIIIKKRILLIPVILIALISCKKFVDVSVPYTATTSNTVFNSDGTAIAVLTGIYADLSQKGNNLSSGFTNISTMTGLSADELKLHSGISNVSQVAYYRNDLSTSKGGFEYWQVCYPYIAKCNAAIEALNNATGLSSNVKKQLLGEAKFLRAFFYFYLVNLYGDVPLVTSTDFKVNQSLPRSQKSEVYKQIISDLKDAQEFLDNNYLNETLQAYTGTPEKVRPNKFTATSLLSRVYLYNSEWSNAEAQASLIINSGVYSLDSLNGVFLKNSKEAIWQLQPTRSGRNTEDAWRFIIPASGPGGNYPVYLSNNLLNSFEIADQRKSKWIGTRTIGTNTYSYPYKYKSATLNAPVTEYLMVFRLGELYLIRAEARTKQNNLSGAISDLDNIRQRAGLPLIAIINPGISQSDLLDKILHERQIELFSEWAHRWLDLKRTGNVDAVMTLVAPQKSGVWQTTDHLYPIPITDIQKDPNLTQNSGY
ncbi:MAG: RagB/SusD family nutrient uptake outer membrane protein [Chitinophagaceae bacterium]